MVTSIVFAIVAMLCYGVNDFLFKRAAQQGAASHQLMMILTLIMVPLLLAYGLLTRTVSPTYAALWGSLAAIFSYVGFYNFARSLDAGAVSIVAPIFRLQFVVTALLAIAFLGEHLSPAKFAGLLLAVAAVWLLLGGSHGAKVEISRRAVSRVLIATASVGISLFLLKFALHQGATPATVLLYQIVVLSFVSAISSIVIDRGFSASPTVLRFGALIGVLQAIGFASLLEGLVVGEAIVVVPISQLSFVVAAILGFLFFNERVTTRKTSGLVAAIGAVALLAMAAGQ